MRRPRSLATALAAKGLSPGFIRCRWVLSKPWTSMSITSKRWVGGGGRGRNPGCDSDSRGKAAAIRHRDVPVCRELYPEPQHIVCRATRRVKSASSYIWRSAAAGYVVSTACTQLGRARCRTIAGRLHDSCAEAERVRRRAWAFNHAMRKPSAICTLQYAPVCGALIDATHAAYSNACAACSNASVVGHFPGACQ